MTFFAAGLVAYLCYKVLEGGFALHPGQTVTNFSGRAIGLAVLSFGAAIWLIGPFGGIALVLGIAIHEYGHVAAFRAAGHNDARFRLIPFLGGVAISNKLPKDQLTEFYIAIMGPGIMLVPLVLCGLYLEAFAGGNPLALNFAYTMFLITGAINFFNLLPLWPLDGGRIVRSLTVGLSPRFSQAITLVMSIGLALWALYAKQPLIFIVSILGFSAARHVGAMTKKQPAMTNGQAVTALAAYLLTLYAFWIAGEPLINRLIFRQLG